MESSVPIVKDYETVEKETLLNWSPEMIEVSNALVHLPIALRFTTSSSPSARPM
jgi:hypothetical protein